MSQYLRKLTSLIQLVSLWSWIYTSFDQYTPKFRLYNFQCRSQYQIHSFASMLKEKDSRQMVTTSALCVHLPGSQCPDQHSIQNSSLRGSWSLFWECWVAQESPAPVSPSHLWKSNRHLHSSGSSYTTIQLSNGQEMYHFLWNPMVYYYTCPDWTYPDPVQSSQHPHAPVL
jgi:hypothetical protein